MSKEELIEKVAKEINSDCYDCDHPEICNSNDDNCAKDITLAEIIIPIIAQEIRRELGTLATRNQYHGRYITGLTDKDWKSFWERWEK